MQDQLASLDLGPVAGSDFVPTDALGNGALRTGYARCGWDMGDAVDQAFIAAQPFAAFPAGIKMRLEFACSRRRAPSADATFVPRRYQGIEFLSVDMFVRAAPQSRTFSNF